MVNSNTHSTKQSKLDSIYPQLDAFALSPGLEPRSYEEIVDCGIKAKNFALAAIATETALEENPITLRGLLYRVKDAIEQHIPQDAWERLKQIEINEKKLFQSILGGLEQ